MAETKIRKERGSKKQEVGHDEERGDSGSGKMKEAGRMDGGSEEEEEECKK